MITNCKFCKRDFNIQPHVLKKGYGKFCSVSCARKGNPPKWLWVKKTPETRKKISILVKERFKDKNKHPMWKGGKQSHGNGYVSIVDFDHPTCDSRGRILEHRYVIEKHLGRSLEKHEIVHHINGDKLDNRMENLQVTNRRDHFLMHPEVAQKGREAKAKKHGK